jgi:hypothetical protein
LPLFVLVKVRILFLEVDAFVTVDGEECNAKPRFLAMVMVSHPTMVLLAHVILGILAIDVKILVMLALHVMAMVAVVLQVVAYVTIATAVSSAHLYAVV